VPQNHRSHLPTTATCIHTWTLRNLCYMQHHPHSCQMLPVLKIKCDKPLSPDSDHKKNDYKHLQIVSVRFVSQLTSSAKGETGHCLTATNWHCRIWEMRPCGNKGYKVQLLAVKSSCSSLPKNTCDPTRQPWAPHFFEHLEGVHHSIRHKWATAGNIRHLFERPDGLY
jgi:hypothetical protein